jgi:hypothetical protein
LKLDLTYATQINRVFGPDSPQGKWEGDVVLANFAYTLPVGTLSLFDFYLDIDNVAPVSSNTVGIKLAGMKPLGKLTATYTLAYAQQAEAGVNAVDVDADYNLIEGGLTFAKFAVGMGVELLGSEGVTGFSTPLATLHAFQGWGDKFLATPAAGLEDRYVRFSYPLGKRGRFTNVAALALFHDFTADVGGARARARPRSTAQPDRPPRRSRRGVRGASVAVPRLGCGARRYLHAALRTHTVAARRRRAALVPRSARTGVSKARGVHAVCRNRGGERLTHRWAAALLRRAARACSAQLRSGAARRR